jgi:hypothetical protein
MTTEKIAGTSYRRLWESTEDMTLAFVVSDRMHASLWCIGCTLEPTREVIILSTELSRHALQHFQAAQGGLEA